MGERSSGECSSDPNPGGIFETHNLLGCPLDTMTSDQIAKPRAMIGTWNYINQTNNSGWLAEISGKITFSDYGNFTLKIPSKTIFGDYKLEGSWGSIGHKILECYLNGCVNNTLISITPNQIEFKDTHNDHIFLTKTSEQRQQGIETEGSDLLTGTNTLDPRGTWTINSTADKITFYNYVKYELWKYTKYCCNVDIQKYIITEGHKTYQGYWQSEIAWWNYPNPTLDLCANNLQDHGVYRDDVPQVDQILSGCAKTTVNVIDNNHIDLHNSTNMWHLTRG